MDALYQARVNGKLYRLWYELNKNNSIKIQTSVGMTSKAETGENVTQGQIGSGLISTLNLSEGVQDFFSGSVDEVSYGTLRLGPVMFQDDLGCLSTSAQGAQAGNHKIETIMNLKQLKINVDKS